MEYKQAKSLLTSFARQIQMLRGTVFALLICNVLLGVLSWHMSNKKDIILVPANLTKKAQITQNGVSRSYLEAMAVMMVNSRLSITPDTIIGSNQDLLKFVSADYYTAFKATLNVEAKRIIKEKVTSSFYINFIHSNEDDMTVIVGGILKRWVGLRFIGQSQKVYRLTFVRNDNFLLLKAFSEVNND